MSDNPALDKYHHEAGKGDNTRPPAVDHKTFSENWERIFGKKEQNHASTQSSNQR